MSPNFGLVSNVFKSLHQINSPLIVLLFDYSIQNKNELGHEVILFLSQKYKNYIKIDRRVSHPLSHNLVS